MLQDIPRSPRFLGEGSPNKKKMLRYTAPKIAFGPSVPRHPKAGFPKAKEGQAEQCFAMQSGPSWAGLGRAGPGRAGLGLAGLGWAGPGQAGPGRAGLGWAITAAGLDALCSDGNHDV